MADDGDPNSEDQFLQTSNRVKTVVAFYPATDMREIQEMINILISYRSDLYARPDLELPRLMALAQELIDLIEADYPE